MLRSERIRAENALTGTTAWQLPRPSDGHEVEGFADRTSVAAGERLSLLVNTIGDRYRVDVFRMGWYSGAGGRLMLTVDDLPGRRQPPPVEDDRGMRRCRWEVSVAFDVPADWTSGVYLVKLSITAPDAAAGLSSWVPFVVRADDSEAFLVQSPVTTSQAYNLWGGRSLYNSNSPEHDYWVARGLHGVPVHGERSRSFAVSFDRPNLVGVGAGHFLHFEYPMVRWLERESASVSYCTNLDLDRFPHLLAGRRAFLSLGHDEYWSYQMRTALELGIDAGVSAGFFGANPMYWQVRLEPSALGARRSMVCYKEWQRVGDKKDPKSFLAVDPYRAEDPRRATTLWRGVAELGRPEQQVVGQMYEDWVNDVDRDDLIVAGGDSWPWTGTGVADGDRIPGVVGQEVDRVFDHGEDWWGTEPPGLGTPSGRIILAASTAHRSPSGTETRTLSFPQNTTHLETISGARVFSAGTMYWSWGLDDLDLTIPAPPGWVSHHVASPALRRLTRNVLSNFCCGRIAVVGHDSAGGSLEIGHAERWSPDSPLNQWRRPADIRLAGRFTGSGRDEILLISVTPPGPKLMIGAGLPVEPVYWEQWGESAILDGWLDDGDTRVAGDFLGRGHDQVLFLNRTGAPGEGRLMICDYAGGPPAEVAYWDQSSTFDGWLDDGDSCVAGDFLGRGHDQVLFVNRDGPPGEGRLMICDFAGGPPADVAYWDVSSTLGDGGVRVTGDFLAVGHDQVMVVSQELTIWDFSDGPPAEVAYREKFSALDDGDTCAAGDFLGRGHDQVLVISQVEAAGQDRVVIRDFSAGPPAELAYRLLWGARPELDGWFEAPAVLTGDFAGVGSDQLAFLPR